MNVIIQLAQPHSRALSTTLYSKSIQNRDVKCHGYDGYIRVKILGSWGKSLGEHIIWLNLAFFGKNLRMCVRFPCIFIHKLAKIGRVVNNCSLKVSFMLILFRFSAKTVAIYAFVFG